MTTPPIRVLIVDDSPFIQQMLYEWFQQDPQLEVVDVAGDPHEAREKIKATNPDVITLDVEMPHMDGVTFLEKLMRLRPMPVVMVSTLTTHGADMTLRALELGAVDYVGKPGTDASVDWKQTLQALSEKVKIAAQAQIHSSLSEITANSQVVGNDAPLSTGCQIIGIGASTGGVEALHTVLSQLPLNMPPIVVVQHMIAAFTKAFSGRLDSVCRLKVLEAQHQQKLLPGHVYIAPGDRHLRITKQEHSQQFWSKIGDDQPVSGHCPSVDVLFDSLVQQAGANAIGIILTGMGKDGVSGLTKMRRTGAMTLGQDEKSCVVYGMPRAAYEAGAIMKQVSLTNMATELVNACKNQPGKAVAS